MQPLNDCAALTEHGLTELSIPPLVMVNVIVTYGVNPLPNADTIAPFGPADGLSVSAGFVTVNGAVA
jgi:hypothetical protein